MVRIASQPKPAAPAWHEVFLRMMPAIRHHARIVFRQLDAESRDECIQAVVCNCCSAVARLAELGKLDLAYPTVLARFGVAQVKDGRMTGGHLNCKDVSSPYCHRLKGVVVKRLDKYDRAIPSGCVALSPQPLVYFQNSRTTRSHSSAISWWPR